MSEMTGSGENIVGQSGRPEYVTVDKVTAVRALLALHLLAMVAAFLPESVPGVVTAPPVVFALTFVPGGLAVLLMYDDIQLSPREILYAMGFSLVTLLAMGLVINLLLPVIGIEQPLSPLPLAVSVTVIVCGLAVAVLKTKSSETVAVSLPLPLSPALVSLALLPLLSILSVTYLNVTGNNVPILVLLVALAVFPLVAVLYIDVRWHAHAVWFFALAILFHKSFWKNFGFSGSPGVIRTWQANRWTPGVTEVHPYSTELLQNGVLFPTYARLSGITIITELEVVNPFLIAFIPLAVFVATRQYFESRHALLAAALFAFAHPFYIQYPTGGRAATPVLFLSLFAVVLTDDDTSTVRTSLLGLLFAAGIVVSHYGTSYFVMFAFLGALAFMMAIRFLDTLIDDRLSEVSPDGGMVMGLRPEGPAPSARSVLRWTFALYYTVAAIGWYMYATQGEKFSTLPNHMIRSVSSMTNDEVVSGRTGARIQRDYGSTSVRLSKIMYVGFGLLMGFGIMYAFYRRYFKRDGSSVDDHYIVLASVMLAIFGATFVARTWGGGRPMMITLAFTSTFAPFGAIALARFGIFAEQKAGNLSLLGSLPVSPIYTGAIVFALLLAVLFSLNSGIASAVVFDDRPPSNVPRPEAQESYKEIDIASHVWITNYAQGNAYGDPIAQGQTDWYLPSIALQTPGTRAHAGVNHPRGGLVGTLRDDTVYPGYIMLLSHNTQDGELVEPYTTEDVPLSEFEDNLEQRNKIYSTGTTATYYTPDSMANVTA